MKDIKRFVVYFSNNLESFRDIIIKTIIEINILFSRFYLKKKYQKILTF